MWQPVVMNSAFVTEGCVRRLLMEWYEDILVRL